jgi:hypothetical protein
MTHPPIAAPTLLPALQLFLLSALQLFSPSALSSPPSTLGGDFALIFADEFDGPKLDDRVWVSQAYETQIKNDTARGPGNLEVRDGKLLLHVRKETRTIGNRTVKWTSGYVHTRETFGPNTYYEARFKSGQSPGVNNAFWLASISAPGKDGYRDRYEIDIVEARKDMRIPDIPGALNGYGNQAWHDWKTFAYAKDDNGKPVDIAQGQVAQHTFDNYHTWGLWLGETTQIYYLDGVEYWRGEHHNTHRDQWRTGTGKLKHFPPDREKSAYGRHGQPDWSYLGGYTGDRMNIIFSNLPWGEKWTPLTDTADGTFMAIDYVRAYKPARLVSKTPTQKTALQTAAPSTPSAPPAPPAPSIALSRPINVYDRAPGYISITLRKTAGAAPRVLLLGSDGNPVATLGVTADNHLYVSIGNAWSPASTQTAWPAREQKKAPFFKDDTDYLIVARITPRRGNDNPAISACAFPLDQPLPADEPFFYANITPGGSTNLTNGWHINQKRIAYGSAVSLRVENTAIAGEIHPGDFRLGTSFNSVLPE